MKELPSQSDEERKCADHYQECLVKVNDHSKKIEIQLYEPEEEHLKGKTAKRNVKRKLDDSQEDYENLQREINMLKNKIKRNNISKTSQKETNLTYSSDLEDKRSHIRTKM